MHEIIAVGQAIVDPTRVRIIASLRRGELCVCELVDALGSQIATRGIADLLLFGHDRFHGGSRFLHQLYLGGSLLGGVDRLGT
jgi:DNA-binding transcriptional ArsR family regulator